MGIRVGMCSGAHLCVVKRHLFLLRSQLYLWGSPFCETVACVTVGFLFLFLFFFVFVFVCLFVCFCFVLLCFFFVVVFFLNPTVEVVTFRLRELCVLGMFLSRT